MDGAGCLVGTTGRVQPTGVENSGRETGFIQREENSYIWDAISHLCADVKGETRPKE